MNSIWSEHSKIPQYPQLRKDINTDVLIIGGGMCGIMCAYFLKQKGIDYVLVEGERIGQGITKNTTAKITSQHGLLYSDLIKNAGVEQAKMYLEANEKAIAKFRMLCRNIDCEFEQKDAYTYSLTSKRRIEEEVKAVNKLGYRAEYMERLPLPLNVRGAIKFGKQAQFNPLLFLEGIAKELNIYENTYVRDIQGHTAITDRAKIRAKKIIVATHFPIINKHGSYFLKMYQHRSYAIALENAPKVNGMYVDEAQSGMSFRNYKNMLIIGGGDHRTGKSGGNWEELRTFVKKNYPKAIERYSWATQDCMSLDGIPYIGHYSRLTPHLYVATGFNKWGMTSSMVAAMILSDMVMGKRNEWEEVYSPHRSMLKQQLLINGVEAVCNLLTPTVKRCPHMGCALKWNKIEHTWDCPCHGSRFSREGNLIDNPAKHNMNV
ncbi:FAD-dependent oxidoreductase [Anaerosporobacter sp.]|uniref:FAD-dependent oxidoreductase n=1 Tax=Anaerosporobacter sp. TaxID=1872529 RepID=UPI00286EB5E8|nr:FAD-dependent oxidoreductase [Anaerosporobacter sp.]